MERSTTTADCRCVGSLLVGRKLLLKSLNSFTKADPMAADTFGDGGYFGFADQRSAKDNAVLPRTNRSAASHGWEIGVGSAGRWDSAR